MDFSRIVYILGRRWPLVLAVFCMTAAGQIVFLFGRTPSIAVESTVEVIPPTLSDQVAVLQVPRALQTNVMFLKHCVREKDWSQAVLERLPAERRPAARDVLRQLEVVPDLAKNTARIVLSAPDEEFGMGLLEQVLAVLATTIGGEIGREVEGLLGRIDEQRRAVDADLEPAEETLGRLRGAGPSEGTILGWDEETTAARTRLQAAEARLEELKTKEAALLRGIRDLEVMPPPQQLRAILGDSLLAEMLERQFKEILEKYAELLRRQIHLTDLHPDIRKLRDDIASAETVFESFTAPSGELYPLVAAVYKTAKDKLASEIEGRRGELAALRESVADVGAKLEAARHGAELLRQNRAEYVRSFARFLSLKGRKEKLAQAGEELRLLSENAPTRVRTVSPPAASRTKRLPFDATLWLAFVLAALVASGVCCGVEMFDQRVHDAGQIRAGTKAPILAMVPHVAAGRQDAFDGGLEETFALLARKLTQCAPAPASVAVCATTKGTGTTFVVDGLARVAASFGSRVLIVECAPPARTTSRVRARCSREGLDTVLSGVHARRRALQAAAQGVRTFSDFLALAEDAGELPAAATPWPLVHRLRHGDGPLPNADLEDKMTRLLASVKRRYDLVLIDCPPVMDSPYATLLGGVADGVVLVLRAQVTRINSFIETLRRWEGTGLTLFGVVLNDAHAPAWRRSAARAAERTRA